MKRLLKVLGILLGIVLLLALCGAAYIHFSGIPSYEVKLPEYPEFKPDSTMIAEGKRLATMVCNQCHSGSGGRLEGKYMADVPAMFGKAYAANITSHPEFGAGRYSNAEIAYLLRTGIKRDGKYAPPWMPKFPHLSDQDMQSIIAYLRSDAPELAPSDKVQPAQEPSFLSKFLCQVAFKPLPYPTTPVVAPPITDKVAYGRYLVTGKVDCFGCHSASFETTNVMEPEKTPGYLGGGNPMPDLEGNIVVTRNLTMDKETGLGNWTEEQFVKALRTGQKPDNTVTRYPMVPYAVMTEEEAKAIWAYLQTVPVIKNDVNKPK